MAEKSTLSGGFLAFDRGPIGAVTMAGRHVDLPPVANRAMSRLACFALVLVTAGRGVHENAAGAREPVGPGDFLLIFPGVDYRYHSADASPWSEWWAHFEGPAFELWRDRGLLDPARPVLHAGPPRYWLRRLEAVVSNAAGSRTPTQAQRVAMLQQVLADAAAHHRLAEADPDDNAWLARVDELIEPHVGAKRPNWRRLARSMGMTYEGFRRRYTRVAGAPPARRHTTRVLERACELLRHPGLSLADIAEACGYCDQFQFSKQFQKHIGLPPGRFRAQIQRR